MCLKILQGACLKYFTYLRDVSILMFLYKTAVSNNSSCMCHISLQQRITQRVSKSPLECREAREESNLQRKLCANDTHHNILEISGLPQGLIQIYPSYR